LNFGNISVWVLASLIRAGFVLAPSLDCGVVPRVDAEVWRWCHREPAGAAVGLAQQEKK